MPTPDIRAAGRQLLKNGLAGRAPDERALLHFACSPDGAPRPARSNPLFRLFRVFMLQSGRTKKKWAKRPSSFIAKVVAPGAQIKAARPATSGF
jgi:hypothetical protein